jgi:hypothetical protein
MVLGITNSMLAHQKAVATFHGAPAIPHVKWQQQQHLCMWQQQRQQQQPPAVAFGTVQ